MNPPISNMDTLNCISELDEEHAQVQCQINRARANVKYLNESISQLSQEVEQALLREKWASKLKAGEGNRHQSPIEDSLLICKELSKSPECLGDVLRTLEQKQSSLHKDITSLMNAINELQNT